MTTRPLTTKALAATAALALLTLSACSSEEEPEAPASPAESVTVEDPTPTPEPTESSEPADEATAIEAADEGHGEVHGEPVEVTGDMRGADSAADYDPHNPMPVGLTVDERAVEWDEGQQVVRDYMRSRYELSYTDPHPSQWLVNTRELSTPDWYSELQQVAVRSELSEEEWARAQQDELIYHVQMLEPLTLDTAFAFGKDEMWVRVPYRTWETSRHSRGDHPSGWDMNDRSWGARGMKWTLMRLVHDPASDAWLVAEEGITPMSPIDH